MPHIYVVVHCTTPCCIPLCTSTYHLTLYCTMSHTTICAPMSSYATLHHVVHFHMCTYPILHYITLFHALLVHIHVVLCYTTLCLPCCPTYIVSLCTYVHLHCAVMYLSRPKAPSIYVMPNVCMYIPTTRPTISGVNPCLESQPSLLDDHISSFKNIICPFITTTLIVLVLSWPPLMESYES